MLSTVTLETIWDLLQYDISYKGKLNSKHGLCKKINMKLANDKVHLYSYRGKKKKRKIRFC